MPKPVPCSAVEHVDPSPTRTDPRVLAVLIAALALVCDSLLARAIGSFFVGLRQPSVPTAMVRSVDDGVANRSVQVRDLAYDAAGNLYVVGHLGPAEQPVDAGQPAQEDRGIRGGAAHGSLEGVLTRPILADTAPRRKSLPLHRAEPII